MSEKDKLIAYIEDGVGVAVVGANGGKKGFLYSFLLARSRQPTLPLLFGRSMFRLTRSIDYFNKYIFHQKREGEGEEEEYIDVCVQLYNAAATPFVYPSDSFLFKYKSKLYGVCVCV